MQYSEYRAHHTRKATRGELLQERNRTVKVVMGFACQLIPGIDNFNPLKTSSPRAASFLSTLAQ